MFLIGEVATGSMEAVITALKTAVTSDVFFGVVKDLMPFLSILIPVSLGTYFLRNMIKGAGRAKVRF